MLVFSKEGKKEKRAVIFQTTYSETSLHAHAHAHTYARAHTHTHTSKTEEVERRERRQHTHASLACLQWAPHSNNQAASFEGAAHMWRRSRGSSTASDTEASRQAAVSDAYPVAAAAPAQPAVAATRTDDCDDQTKTSSRSSSSGPAATTTTTMASEDMSMIRTFVRTALHPFAHHGEVYDHTVTQYSALDFLGNLLVAEIGDKDRKTKRLSKDNVLTIRARAKAYLGVGSHHLSLQKTKSDIIFVQAMLLYSTFLKTEAMLLIQRPDHVVIDFLAIFSTFLLNAAVRFFVFVLVFCFAIKMCLGEQPVRQAACGVGWRRRIRVLGPDVAPCRRALGQVGPRARRKGRATTASRTRSLPRQHSAVAERPCYHSDQDAPSQHVCQQQQQRQQ